MSPRVTHKCILLQQALAYVLLVALASDVPFGAQAAAAGQPELASSTGSNSTSSLKEALLPDIPASQNPGAPQPQQPNSSSPPSSCWGWKQPCVVGDPDKPIFALFGDSITDFGFTDYGWAAKLGAAYGGSVNMVNYGIPGATTRKVDMLYDKFLQQMGPHMQQVKLATVCFGANVSGAGFCLYTSTVQTCHSRQGGFKCQGGTCCRHANSS
jgi:hypothetical protein